MELNVLKNSPKDPDVCKTCQIAPASYQYSFISTRFHFTGWSCGRAKECCTKEMLYILSGIQLTCTVKITDPSRAPITLTKEMLNILSGIQLTCTVKITDPSRAPITLTPRIPSFAYCISENNW